jgi:hypothetical protein
MDGPMDVWADGWLDGRMGRWMDDWMDGWTFTSILKEQILN